MLGVDKPYCTSDPHVLLNKCTLQAVGRWGNYSPHLLCCLRHTSPGVYLFSTVYFSPAPVKVATESAERIFCKDRSKQHVVHACLGRAATFWEVAAQIWLAPDMCRKIRRVRAGVDGRFGLKFSQQYAAAYVEASRPGMSAHQVRWQYGVFSV